MTRDEWLLAFAREAGVERPSPEQIRTLLELAGTAAHASERTAAPITCWLAARSELPLPELLARADALAAPSARESDASGPGA